MSGKVHVLPDENLGGVLREFVEVDRAANVGEKIVIVDPSYFQYGDWYTQGTVMTVTETDEYGNVYCGKYDLIDRDEYRTLEPTDIVHLREENGTERRDGKPSRFRLVERKAEVGEKVIVVKGKGWYENKIGNIYEVISGKEYGVTGRNLKTAMCMLRPPGNEYNVTVAFISTPNYRVLQPLYTCDRCGKALGEVACSNSTGGAYCSAKCADADEPQVEVDGRDASPSVIDMLANLAQRITEIERKLDESRIDFIENELDTLHANQRKLAEDTTNRLDRHSERIRELAEMIGEQKAFKTFKFSDLNGKTLRIYSAQDVTDKSTTTVTVGIDTNDGNMYVLEVKRK
jgi:hypothetical protein